jgi:DNA-binding transcriptional ArsR family regulator
VDTYGDAEAWFTIGDGTRRAILLALAERPQSVGELASGLPVSRPAVSQHLKVLKESDLVTERAEGTRRVYQINAAGLSALRDQLDTFWSRAISAYRDAVEGPEQEKE